VRHAAGRPGGAPAAPDHAGGVRPYHGARCLMSDVLLFTISLAVTALGLLGSWAATRRRGLASGMRGAAWSLVPLGAYLTGLTRFLVDLAFSPVKWAGIAVLGLGGLLYVTSGVMLRRGAGTARRETETGAAPARRAAPSAAPPKGAVGGPGAAADPDLAEIERILKNRGIT
jgi:hypothetical protein